MIELAAICLAMNIYFEARSEPIGGQIAVAQVTMRRANNNKENICGVVLANKQFSWANGKTSKKGGVIIAAFEAPKDKAAWAKAKKVANMTMKKKIWDNSNGATHYHAKFYRGKRLKPKWSKTMIKVAVVGNHIFYKNA